MGTKRSSTPWLHTGQTSMPDLDPMIQQFFMRHVTAVTNRLIVEKLLKNVALLYKVNKGSKMMCSPRLEPERGLNSAVGREVLMTKPR
jgi:hypothetical protein